MELLPILKGAATYRTVAVSRGARQYRWQRRRALLLFSVAASPQAAARLPDCAPDSRPSPTRPGRFARHRLGALLCGADRLYALDVVRYADLGRNTTVLSALVDLFPAGGRRFPMTVSFLSCGHCSRTTPSRTKRCPRPSSMPRSRQERVAAIGSALKGEPSGIVVSYKVPWTELAPRRRRQHRPGVVAGGAGARGRSRVDVSRARALGGAGGSDVARDRSSQPQADPRLGRPPRVLASGVAHREGAPALSAESRAAAEASAMLEQAGFRAARVQRELAQQWLPRERLSRTFQEWSDEDRRTAGLVVQAARIDSPHEARR